jgi:CRISPR-associated protein Csm5
MAKKTPYKIRLHIISPVHIGCDDVYEPTGFVVDKTAKKLIAFDQLDFVRSLSSMDRSKFLAVCEKGTLESIVEIYKFMWHLPGTPPGHEVDVSKGFLDIFERVATKLNPRDAKKELNNFLIGRTSYLSSDQSPYIPGSALKGAIRTGWLNQLNNGQTRPARGLEEMLLGGTFDKDPFRMVKVSDLVPVGSPKTRICFAVNKKKKISEHEPRGPQQILEVIRHDCSAVFEGIITLNTQEQGGGITRPVPPNMEFFTKAAGFFNSEMDAEEAMLKTINLPAAIRTKFVNAFGDRFMKSVFPLRLGRHSGAECLTVDGMRNIKILGKRVNGKQEFTFGPHSTTVWLAGDSNKATSGLLPFGWVALEVMDIDPAAPLWPERTITAKEGQSAVVPLVKTPPPPPERIVWSGAVLTWNPGNQTLTAQGDGKKAEVKLGADKSLVPETMHKKLFVKKDAVKADVTVEQQGNAWRIIDIS